MIKRKESNHHWNYYLAIENDLENVSRFIEFNEDNLKTYSIALTHIILSASSEIDVLLKQICKIICPTKNYENINDYRLVIKENVPEIIDEKIYIHRFGLEFSPWSNWTGDDNPDWWKIHNKIKHERNIYFNKANLKNGLNAVGALLIVVTYFYKYVIQKRYEENDSNVKIDIRSTTHHLNPKSGLLKLKNEYYQYPIYVYD